MENLKALVYKGDLTSYQRSLAQKEFEDLIKKLELLEGAGKNKSALLDEWNAGYNQGCEDTHTAYKDQI